MRIMTLVMFALIVACSQEQTSGGVNATQGQGGTPTLQNNSICYLGADQKNQTCLPLMSIHAASLGYKDPLTEKTNPLPADQNANQYAMPIAAINLSQANGNLLLSPDFHLVELMSIAKGGFGIFSPTVLKLLQQLKNIANSAIQVTSGFRPPDYNSNVSGSAVWSRHMYGDAIDITSAKLTQTQLISICEQLKASFTLTYTDGHIHCDWRNDELDANFYGPQIHPPSKLMAKEIFKNTSQIVVQGDLRVGNIILLSSLVPMNEDPEEITKKWIITAPNRQVFYYESQEVSLPLTQSGIYQIVHNIGGAATLIKTLTVY